MQPWIRTHDADTDHGACDGCPWCRGGEADRAAAEAPAAEVAVPESPHGPRHGAAGDDDAPPMPTTMPITLDAMTYGRHAADEGWGDSPSDPRPPRSAPGGHAAARGTWGRVRDLALRLDARTRGRAE